MAFSNSDWIVKLHYAFQDIKNVGNKIFRDDELLVFFFFFDSLVIYDYGLYARW
jgi:hypothetical protein